ncbi:hypothetical protein KBY84_12585 [Cyanobium sp. N.Huapi 1H5]|uniref:hypothetical protein n=1 Tax=Cyanobium sp. N.Huapi 1H5 TaxID=2823719 RepID=UPI0020CBB9F7|nr:hypothetical protein [Cyanobium sp. N.Huapi 1H5]MCP9838330.1 hypothetical protein [Cyanobium sp. N.Huapi 1H5]
MAPFPFLVIVHALAATVWTGGHLVLDLGVLPRALRERSAERIRDFEAIFEPLGLTALAIQVIIALAIAFVVVGALIRLGGVLGWAGPFVLRRRMDPNSPCPVEGGCRTTSCPCRPCPSP